jgi:pentatricopeptide repeat protein
VDIHAKLGDFEGCAQVIKEMASEGVAPTQAAYTSLLAACYKVCNDGRIPHTVRAEAGKVGWDHWQQMRIVGIEADSMAFGAIIRLCAARGQPERAINILEEMHRFDVKPTTLCFSSALRAVARSHEIGTRFERGWSQKQLRRETFAAHHGKMARAIVILAENAEAELDDGFISALMLCAAAAGDSATAKAVFLAAEVRKMDHLRTIGSESHLKQLRGQINSETELPTTNLEELKGGSAGVDSLITIGDQPIHGNSFSEADGLKTFGEREYG